jgi:steroid delta-isomerase-like uncharacterized protein
MSQRYTHVGKEALSRAAAPLSCFRAFIEHPLGSQTKRSDVCLTFFDAPLSRSAFAGNPIIAYPPLKKKILLGLTADEHMLVQADQFKVPLLVEVLDASKESETRCRKISLARTRVQCSYTAGIKTMNANEVVKRYAEAWHRHDADAIVALFVEGGTYSNPDVGQGLTGQAIADFAKVLFAAFPDMSLEIVSIGDTGGGLVAWQWLARATNTGPLADGNPPTGRSLTLPGASFTQVEGDKIRSEQVYHDRKTKDEQRGLEPK